MIQRRRQEVVRVQKSDVSYLKLEELLSVDRDRFNIIIGDFAAFGDLFYVLLLKVFDYEVSVVTLKVMKYHVQEVTVCGLVGIRALAFLGFQLKITSVASRKQIIARDVTMVFNFIVIVRKRFVAIRAHCGCAMVSQLFVAHRGKRNLLRKNFVNDLALRRDVLVEVRERIVAAIDDRWSLILIEVRNPITAVSANAMFVYDMRFCIRDDIVVDVVRRF